MCVCIGEGESQTCNFIWQRHPNGAIYMSVLFCVDAAAVNFVRLDVLELYGQNNKGEKNQRLKGYVPNWIHIFLHKLSFIVLTLLSKQIFLEHIHSEL